MPTSDASDEEGHELALEVGANLASAAAGSLVAGPVGAALGAVTGPVLTRAGRALASRIRGREEARTLTALGYAAIAIEERLSEGDELRSDGFFQRGDLDRSAADEVAEASLRAAARDPEEMKLPYYGRLLANISFRADISRGTANQLVRTAARLTFRQCVLLALADESSIRPPYFGVEMEHEWGEWPLDVERESVRLDFDELEKLHLVTPEKHRHNNRVLSPPGRDLLGLMGLGDVPEADRAGLRVKVEAGNDGPWTQSATYPDGIPGR